jgi:hypothetical protein
MLNHVSPFASFLIAQSSLAVPNPSDLVTMLRAQMAPVGGWVSESDLTPLAVASIDLTVAYHIVERVAPAWLGGTLVQDTLNHLFACFIKGGHAVIYASDSEIKDRLYEALNDGKILGWYPADENVLLQAYVTGRALRTLWLAGTHRNVTVKPNSKILSGESLADVIDPFGDSTFIAGAIRSTHAGVSLKRSGVWFGRKKDWDLFSLAGRAVLLAVETAAASPTLDDTIVHEGLAQVLRKFKDVGPVSDIEWVPSEAINGERRAQKLSQLSDDFEIEIAGPFLPKEIFHIRISHRSSGANVFAKVVPIIQGKKIRFTVMLVSPDAECQKCADAIERNPDFVRVLYNSSHAIAAGRLTQSTIQDRDFHIVFADFAVGPAPEYDVWVEKPPGNPPPLQNMFTAADRSLFKWVFKEGLAQLGLPLPLSGLCWLYCDDRSGEVADFIHLFTPGGGAPARITLIHVKGAHTKNNGNRNISTSAYEVVTAQAMKNLRRMAWAEMLKAIKDTVTRHGTDRVWDQPWAIGLTSTPATGAVMLAALEAVGTNCDYEVIIVQPHVLESKYMPRGRRASGAAAAQLRNLLFTAKAAANVALADFRVVSARG